MGDVFSVISLALEVFLLLVVFLVAAHRASPRLQVILYRGAFGVALLAPLALLNFAPKAEIFTLQVDATVAAADIAPAANAATPPLPLGFVLFAVWLCGASVVAGRQILALRQLNRVFSRGDRPSPPIASTLSVLNARFAPSTHAELRLSFSIAAPCTFGWLWPKILLPANIKSAAIAPVLTHELCHVRAGDAPWLTIARFACALHWFNPLIWICERSHRSAIEFVCDDAAAADDKHAYIDALIDGARDVARNAAAVMMSSDGVGARVRTLIHRESPMPRPNLMTKLGAYAVAAASVALLGATQLVAAHEPSLIERMDLPSPGNGLFYVEAAPGVRVEETAGRFGCWDDASCVFSTRLNETIVLRGTVAGGGRVAWEGCEPSSNGRTCTLVITEAPIHVVARPSH